MDEFSSYVCDSCGEENPLALDVSGGRSQQFVEDCPVCCRPNLIEVAFDEEGAPWVTARRE